MRNNCFVFPNCFSRNVGNSIKCEKNITTPPPPPQTTPTFEIQYQNKGIEDIMDIDSNCRYLLPVFGETTSHLTSKLNVMDGQTDRRTDRRGVSILFNVENSIKREIRKNCFSKQKNSTPPPPSGIFFLHQFFIFFYVGNSMKREENMKYWKKNIFKFYFFQYLKNS